MGKATRFFPEVRERAIRLVSEQEGQYESQWAAIRSDYTIVLVPAAWAPFSVIQVLDHYSSASSIIELLSNFLPAETRQN